VASLVVGPLHVESPGVVNRLATSPASEVSKRARGVGVGASGLRKRLLGGSLGTLVGDRVGDDVLVDDLGLACHVSMLSQF